MAKQADPIRLLSQVPLFEGLTKKELHAIHESAKEVEFAPGRSIVEEGTTGVAFHLILDGKAKVSVKGRQKAMLGPGDYFGEISLIDRGRRSATVSAETGVRTLTIASWNFLQLLDEMPGVSKKLLVGLCRRIREIEASAISH